MKERTEGRGQNENQIGEDKRSGRLVDTADAIKEHAKWRRLQRKNLNILGLLKRKVWPQCHRERAVEKYARAGLTKRERNKAICPEHQIVRRAYRVREVKRAAAKE